MKEKSISTIKGIGEKNEALLNKLAIENIDDLIKYYPYRYIEYTKAISLSEALKYIDEDKVIIRAKLVKEVVNRFLNKLKVTHSLISDSISNIEVCWYNSPYLSKTLKLYREYIFVGKLTNKKTKIVLEHPIIYNIDEYERIQGSFKPVYSLTKGLTNNAIIKYINSAFQSVKEDEYYEYLPKFIIDKYNFKSRYISLHNIHFPSNRKEYEEAKKRLIFDEFFTFVYNTKLLKKKTRDLKSNFQFIIKENYIKEFRKLLPFELTKAQENVINEITKDLSSGNIMNRLIQGDVGSGKTIISIFAMYIAYLNFYQSALMVPTEVLAKQHFENISKLFKILDNAPKVALLTGSMTKKQHLEVYEGLENGSIDIVIGTHALITEKVKYKNLALVITDEQHRFGVRQRQSLADKGIYPHILVMSATPIPRTLAVILYGDLDISIVDAKPEGRLEIKNALITKNDRIKAYKHIEKELEKGHQAYVICSMVEESENIEAQNVIDYTDILKKYFKNKYKIEFLHGKMTQAMKDELMQSFVDKKIDILVSTTVIEVGIDVKNATVMLIEDAQRFGLASLHQLRGRVGRSNIQSYCIFVGTSNKKEAKKRLEIISHSNDGFYIASEDMKLRGSGELFGFAQSGEFSFGLGNIYSDSDILKEASSMVTKVFNIELSKKENELLNRRVQEIAYENYKKLTL